MATFAVACLTVGPAPAQQPSAGQQFLDGMAKVRAQVRTARFELAGQQLFTAESHADSNIPDHYFPAQDARGEFTQTTILDFANNRFRNDFAGIQLFGGDEGYSVAPARKVTTYDGQHLYLHVPKDSGNGRWFEGAGELQWEIARQDRRMLSAVFFLESYPMLFACGRLPDPGENYRIDAIAEYNAADWQPRGGAAVEGVRCAVFRWVYPTNPTAYWDWFVDVKDPSRVIRCQRASAGHVVFDLEIKYDGTARMPSAWVMRNFDNDNPGRRHKLARQWDYKVVKAEINTETAEDEFRPDLAPNMLMATEEGLKRVRGDGHSLESVSSRPDHWWPYVCGLGALGVVFGLLMYTWRRRRAASARSGPEEG